MCISGPIIPIIDLMYEYWKTIPPDGLNPKTKKEIESYQKDFILWLNDKSINKLITHGLMLKYKIITHGVMTNTKDLEVEQNDVPKRK